MFGVRNDTGYHLLFSQGYDDKYRHYADSDK